MVEEAQRKQRFMRDGRPRPERRHKKPTLTPRYIALLDGSLKLEDLDDEELFRGQLRSSDGLFRGPHPQVIPWVMHREAMEGVSQRLERSLAGNIQEILDSMVNIATGTEEAGGEARVKAQTYLLDRIMGKPVERSEMTITHRAKWEEALEGGEIIVDIEDDIVDAEVVEQPAIEGGTS
jgi:hypothetical protein